MHRPRIGSVALALAASVTFFVLPASPQEPERFERPPLQSNVINPDGEFQQLKEDLQSALDEFFGEDQTLGALVDRILASSGNAGIKAAVRAIPKKFYSLRLPRLDGPSLTFQPFIDDLDPFDDRSDISGAECLIKTASLHTAATLIDLLAVYPTEVPASMFEFIAAMTTKCCSGILLAPEDKAFTPPSTQACEYVLQDQRIIDEAGYLFYFPSPFTPPKLSGWGELGTPRLFHYNSDYALRLLSVRGDQGQVVYRNPLELDESDPICLKSQMPPVPGIDYPDICLPSLFKDPGDDPLIPNPFVDDPADLTDLALPIGRNRIAYRADTLVSLLDFLYYDIPEVPDENPAAKKIDKKLIKEFLKGLVDDAKTAQFFQSFVAPRTDAIAFQDAVVYDITPPVITSNPSSFLNLEGLEIGGASLRSYRTLLEGALTATDSCDRPVTIVPPPLAIWPVDQTVQIEWTAVDAGPNPQGGRNSATTTQTIRVVDTKPPILKRPDGIVAEWDSATETPPVAVRVRPPEFFDLVDPDPTIQNDALTQPGVQAGPDGYRFPPGVTRLSWTATDQSGNVSAPVVQIVNVKELGTNTVPQAIPQTDLDTIETPWFTETEIVLGGLDPNLDPLNFRISDFPEGGFLVSPLFPYFVEDFRVIDPGISRCTPNRDPALIVDPEYVEITDDGRTYVLNAPLEIQPGCNPDGLFQELNLNRITMFDEAGNFVTGRDLPRSADLFGLYVDTRAGYILYASNNSYLKLDLDTLETLATYRFPFDSNVRKGVIDSNGVLYTAGGQFDPGTGGFEIRAWDLRGFPEDPDGVDVGYDRLLGTMDVYPIGFPDADLALDSTDALYILSPRSVTKYAPSSIAANDSIVFGELIGWLGECVSGSGCEISKRRSFGYACRPGTCVAPTASERQETGPGQFGRLGGFAIDPNDNLYVPGATPGNERVQRFTPQGFFAGQAKSNCDAEDRCFVLGDFGAPRAVSVNSEHFHVLDRDLDILHVFETSVITPIDDTTAKVTYKSNVDTSETFDSFAFTVDDGLATSAPAIVQVHVGKRPPVARGSTIGKPVEDQIASGLLTVEGLRRDEVFVGSFAVAREPEHGVLTVDGHGWTYEPEPNFNGIDSFDVIATDDETGLSSEPAQVEIRVAAVNDPPTVSAPSPQTIAGVGFPFAIRAEITDVDLDDSYSVEVDWGDGTVTRSGAAAAGAVILNAFGEGAVVLARHTYAGAPTSRDVEVCVTDNVSGEPGVEVPTATSITDCSAAAVEVVAMSGLRLAVEDDDRPLQPGETVTLRFVIMNEAPPGAQALATLLAAGTTSVLDATGVGLRIPLFEGTAFVSAAPSQGSCATGPDPENQALTAVLCQIGSLAVAEIATVDLTLQYTGDAFVDGIVAVASADQEIQSTPNIATGALNIACDPRQTGACDDGLVCNGTETCSDAGICQPGLAPPCADGDACTVDTCVEPDGCVSELAASNVCSDGDPCNGFETCQAGVCAPANGPSCTGGNVCTETTCQAGIGCVSTPVTGGVCAGECVDIGTCLDGRCVGLSRCDSLCEFCTVSDSCASLCGVPVSRAARSTATDALFVLRSAVALETCGLCACDVDGNGLVTATDALAVLSTAVGTARTYTCPAVFSLETSITTTTLDRISGSTTSTSMPATRR